MGCDYPMVRKDIDERLPEILYDYENGTNIKTLCEKYDVSYNTLRKRLGLVFNRHEIREMNRRNNVKSEEECLAISRRQNTSGYYRVSMNGSSYVYTFYVDGVMHRITRRHVDDLRRVVVGLGLTWIEF